MSPMKTVLLDVALVMVSYHINRKVANIEGIKCEEQQDVCGRYSVYNLSPPPFFHFPFFLSFSLLHFLISRLLHDI